jgi:hypothetical protein
MQPRQLPDARVREASGDSDAELAGTESGGPPPGTSSTGVAPGSSAGTGRKAPGNPAERTSRLEAAPRAPAGAGLHHFESGIIGAPRGLTPCRTRPRDTAPRASGCNPGPHLFPAPADSQLLAQDFRTLAAPRLVASPSSTCSPPREPGARGGGDKFTAAAGAW